MSKPRSTHWRHPKIRDLTWCGYQVTNLLLDANRPTRPPQVVAGTVPATCRKCRWLREGKALVDRSGACPHHFWNVIRRSPGWKIEVCSQCRAMRRIQFCNMDIGDEWRLLSWGPTMADDSASPNPMRDPTE